MRPRDFNVVVAVADPEVRRAVITALDPAGVQLQIPSANPVALAATAASEPDCVILDEELACGAEPSALAATWSRHRPVPLILIGSEEERVGAPETILRGDLDGENGARRLRALVRLHRAEREATVREHQLSRRSLYDPLTALANRVLFFDRVQQLLALARREKRSLALLIMDLRRFRGVNSTLGHEAGDGILREVADRLRAVTRESDALARIGDDQFTCLLPTRPHSAGAAAMAERIIKALERPFVVGSHRLVLAINIGIATYPTDADDGATLVRHAELALQAARRDGARFAVHTRQNDRDALRQLALASDLRHAVARDELVLLFQPKVAVPRGNALGVEALVRWQSARRGLIPPDVFIPIAEETGFIGPLTRWVQEAALRAFDGWRQTASLILPVAVNLSPISLHDRNFSSEVAALLGKWSVPPACLVFEITESAIMADVARATETVERLRDMGVGIVIDDFGTGYSSLAYIHRLPVSEIKVDKSFVLSMKMSPDDAVIVRSIIDLGRNLGLEVTAEGVEDADVWGILAALECSAAQGCMISRPVEAAAVAEWVRDRSWLPSAPRSRLRDQSVTAASQAMSSGPAG